MGATAEQSLIFVLEEVGVWSENSKFGVFVSGDPTDSFL